MVTTLVVLGALVCGFVAGYAYHRPGASHVMHMPPPPPLFPGDISGPRHTVFLGSQEGDALDGLFARVAADVEAALAWAFGISSAEESRMVAAAEPAIGIMVRDGVGPVPPTIMEWRRGSGVPPGIRDIRPTR